MMTHLERLRDESGFIHKKIGGFIGGLPVIGGIAKELLSGVPLVGGLAEEFFFGGVPGVGGCPPGFFASPTGCVPRASPDPRVGPITSGGFGGGISAIIRRKAAEQRGGPFRGGARPPNSPIPRRPPWASHQKLERGADPSTGYPHARGDGPVRRGIPGVDSEPRDEALPAENGAGGRWRLLQPAGPAE